MYEIPASQASIGQNRFDFRHEGVTYSVPLLKFLSPGFVRRLTSMSQAETVFALLDEFAPDLTDRLEDMHQVDALYRAWAEASGVDLGESSGSGDSSVTTPLRPVPTYSEQDDDLTGSEPTA